MDKRVVWRRIRLLILFCLFSAALRMEPHAQFSKTGFGNELTGAANLHQAALIEFTDPAGVLRWRAGVNAVEPTTAALVFVDQNSARSGIVLSNPADQAAELSLTVRDASGTRVGAITFRLNPHEQRTSFLDEYFPNVSSDFIGSLSFEAQQKLAAIGFREQWNQHGEAIFSLLPVIDVTQQFSSRELFLPLFSALPDFTSDIVLVNSTGDRAMGEIRFIDPKDQRIDVASDAYRVGYDIPGNGVLHLPSPTAATLSSGHAIITSSQGPSPAAIVIFRTQQNGRVVSEAAASVMEPTTAVRIPVEDGLTRTGIALVNPHSIPTNVTFSLLDASGRVRETATRDVLAEAQLTVFDDALFREQADSGSFIAVTSALPVAVMSLAMTANTRHDIILSNFAPEDMNDAGQTVWLLPRFRSFDYDTQVTPLAPRGSVGPATLTVSALACDPLVQNPIVCENQQIGNPKSEWDITGVGDANIQGFASEFSVNKGNTVNFKVNTAATSYRIDIYRLGFYGGTGARKVATVNPSVSLPQAQPACVSDTTTGLIDCGNWQTSASWSVPATAVSGVYIAKLVGLDGTTGASHIAFVVRDDASHSPMLFQTSDTTWQAYNNYGGNSLYTGAPANRAYKVSYNRPFNTRAANSASWVFDSEYP